MKIENLTDWVQIIATLGVLAGLIAVVVEIRQATEFAEIERIDRYYSEMLENMRASLEESTSESLTKACFSPQSLTEKDIYTLDRYFGAVLLASERAAVIARRTNIQLSTNATLRATREITGTNAGYAWLEALKLNLPEEVQQAIEITFSNQPESRCSEFIPRFAENLGANNI